jgi:ribose-phosphate pyrophosphokinase
MTSFPVVERCIEAVRAITERGGTTPVCVAVHGLFADNSDALLAQTGARVVTSNTIPHEMNGIDVAELLASSIPSLLRHLPETQT